MRTAIIALSLWVMSASAIAQEAAPVATDPDDVLDRDTVSTMQFGTAAPDSGTVNPHAVTGKVMTSSGLSIAVAIDSDKPDQATPNVLRLDFSGAGKFDDKIFVPRKTWTDDGSIIHFEGVIKAVIGDKTYPMTVKAEYRKMMIQNDGATQPAVSYRWLNIGLGTGLESRSTIDGQEYIVRLMDGPGMNFKFNDKPYVSGRALRRPGDTVAVYWIPKDPSQKPNYIYQGYYAQPAPINGKWHNILLSEDGKKIEVTPFKGEMGKAIFSQENWAATMVGKQHVIRVSGGPGAMDLPADEYLLSQTSITLLPASQPATSQPTAPLQLTSRAGNPSDQTPIVISPQKEAKVVFGPPLTIKPEVSRAGDGINIRMSIIDSGGLVCAVNIVNDKVPEFTITDADGKELATGKMGFG